MICLVCRGIQQPLVHIPFDTLIKKLVEKSGESRENIDKRIAEKLNEFSGLISKEGAANIVANELNIPIGDIAAGPFKMSELRLGMKNITVCGKVITKYNVTTFAKNGREGRVASLLFADLTGNCRVTFWHDDVLLHERILENDVISLTNLSTKENRSVLELTASANTRIVRDISPVDAEALSQIASRKGANFNQAASGSSSFSVSENSSSYAGANGVDASNAALGQSGQGGRAAESVSSSGSGFARTAAVRKSICDISATDALVEVVGVVVQVFKPAAFTVDKTTGKKVRLDPGMPADVLHHEQRYVMNIVVDDGTETVRAVFFGDECQRLIGAQSASVQSLQMLKENEYEFSKAKTQLLGRIIQLSGKVVKNQLYDRIELITRSFIFNPDPAKELALLVAQPQRSVTIVSTTEVSAGKNDVESKSDDTKSNDAGGE